MELAKLFDETFQKLIKDNPEVLLYSDKSVTNEETTTNETQKRAETQLLSQTLQCSNCNVEFPNVQQQREHYKLDWHRYNLKQNLQGRRTVSEEAFNGLSDDLSSISGSDSEEETLSENLLVQVASKIYVKTSRGQIFSLFRCLLADKKAEITNVAETLIAMTDQWTILMIGGGHFAGAVFKGDEIVVHKTFHCYTVRAGQGTSQSSRDNKGSSAPKSAGANLRRVNEQSMVQHVTDLLGQWSKEIEGSSLILIRAPGAHNKSVLFSGGSGLKRNDPRLRTVPISTRRATFKEVKRVYAVLSTFEVYDSLKDIPKEVKGFDAGRRNKQKNPSVDRAKSREMVERPLPVEISSEDSSENFENLKNLNGELTPHPDEVEFAMENLTCSFKEVLEEFDQSPPHKPPAQKKKNKKVAPDKKLQLAKKKEEEAKQKEDELRRNGAYLAIVAGNIEQYQSFCTGEVNEVLDSDGNTALHLAALHENEDLVKMLLDLHGDVCIRNVKHQTPYTMTQNKKIREVFKVYAAENPDKFNYVRAQIPLPVVQSDLTAEEIAEKKRQQKKAKRDREKVKKKEKQLEVQEAAEKERFASLSDREKRALAAERRIRNNCGEVILRCFLCGISIGSGVPFEYDGNKFCSVKCMKNHRMNTFSQLAS